MSEFTRVQDNYTWDENEELAFDAAISSESSFTLLDEGEYDYVITKVERTRYGGSSNLPACNEVDVTCKISGRQGETTVTTRFFLVRKLEWKLSQFFISLALKKPGEDFVMNWNITGKRGRCKVGIRTYTKDGEERKANEITEFLPPVSSGATYRSGEF